MYPLPEEEEQSRLVVRIRNGASIPTYEEASVSAKPAAVFIIQAFDVPSTLTSFAFGVGAHPLKCNHIFQHRLGHWETPLRGNSLARVLLRIIVSRGPQLWPSGREMLPSS